MSKRFFQFIATLFLLIGAAMFYVFYWAAPAKVERNWIFGMLAGLVALIGVLIFVWVARRKSN